MRRAALHPDGVFEPLLQHVVEIAAGLLGHFDRRQIVLDHPLQRLDDVVDLLLGQHGVRRCEARVRPGGDEHVGKAGHFHALVGIGHRVPQVLQVDPISAGDREVDEVFERVAGGENQRVALYSRAVRQDDGIFLAAHHLALHQIDVGPQQRVIVAAIEDRSLGEEREVGPHLFHQVGPVGELPLHVADRRLAAPPRSSG